MWSLLVAAAGAVWLAFVVSSPTAEVLGGDVRLVADAATGSADGSGTSDQPSTDGSGSHQPQNNSGGSGAGSGTSGSDGGAGSGSGASSGGAQAQDGSGSTDTPATDGSQTAKPAASNSGSGTPAPANNAPAPTADGSSTTPANDACPDGGCTGPVPGQHTAATAPAGTAAERASTPEEQCKISGGCGPRPLAPAAGSNLTAMDGSAEACRDGGPGCNPLAVVASRTAGTTGADVNDTYSGVGGNQPQQCAPGKPCPGSDQPATPALPGGPANAGPGVGGPGHGGGTGAATLADRTDGLDPDQVYAITAIPPRNPNYSGLSSDEIRGPPTPLIPTSGDLDELRNQQLAPLFVNGRYTPQLSGGAASPLKAQLDPYQLAAAGGLPKPRPDAEQGEQPLPPTAATRPGRTGWGKYIDDRANAQTPEWFRSGPQSVLPNLTQRFTADTADGLYEFTQQLRQQRQISVPEAEQLAEQRWGPVLNGNWSKLGRDYWEQPGPTLAQDLKALTKPDRDTGGDFLPLALGNAAGGLRDTAVRMFREQNMYEGPPRPELDRIGMSREEFERKAKDDPYGFLTEKIGDASLIIGGAGAIGKAGALGRTSARAEAAGNTALGSVPKRFDVPHRASAEAVEDRAPPLVPRAQPTSVAPRATGPASDLTGPTNLSPLRRPHEDSPFVDLYHGTSARSADNIRANGIDLSKSDPFTDFGLGFYTTKDLEIAQARVDRMTADGSKGELLHYRIPLSDLNALHGKSFSTPDLEWQELVRRGRLEGGFTHDYDWVEGPALFRGAQWLKGGPLSAGRHQMSFHTPNALELLMRSLVDGNPS